MKLDDAIKRTIAYAKKHNCELSGEEIGERLISDKIYSQKEINKYKTLHPVGTSLDPARGRAGREALIKIKKAKKLSKLLERKFKDILMVGITGSVAAGYPDENDDIDLMIITKKNTLWLTRLKLRYFIYTKHIPHRKYGQKENRDEFCFNLWLDEDKLLLPKSRQNLKSAVDLILMKAILNRENAYEKFILENDWAKKWVATGYSLKPSAPDKIGDTSLDREALLDKVVNWLVFIPQYLFMKKRIKSEEISLKQAIFNEK